MPACQDQKWQLASTPVLTDSQHHESFRYHCQILCCMKGKLEHQQHPARTSPQSSFRTSLAKCIYQLVSFPYSRSKSALNINVESNPAKWRYNEQQQSVMMHSSCTPVIPPQTEPPPAAAARPGTRRMGALENAPNEDEPLCGVWNSSRYIKRSNGVWLQQCYQ